MSMKENDNELETLAQALMEYETLTGEEIKEVLAGKKILQTLGLRKNAVEVVSCPTCARTEIDVEGLANKVEMMTAGIDKPIKISILGCPLNGIGEGENSDLGIAGGKEKSVILLHGKILKTVPSERLMEEFDKILQEVLSN